MEKRIKQLLTRLTFLGYRSFEIKNIVHEAIGSYDLETMSKSQHKMVMRNLERYEKLGSNYLKAYSK